MEKLANAVLAEAGRAREDVEGLPAGAAGMAAQCEQSVRARAEAVLAGLAETSGIGQAEGLQA